MTDADKQQVLRDLFAEQDISHEITHVSSDPVRYGGLADIHSGLWTRNPGKSAKVAIKFVRVNESESVKVLRRYQREMRVWGTAEHPNILPLLGICWTTKMLPGMVSPWCEAGDLVQYVASIPVSRLRRKYELLHEIACGLAYLHQYEPVIVHGDLKGANILVTAAGIARICDFGLSRMMAEFTVTLTSVKGTLRWMAPELLVDENARHTIESDIWAYACVIIEVFSGRPPYSNKANDQKVLMALMQLEPPARPENAMPDEIWEMASKCFAVEPTERLPASLIMCSMVFCN